MQNETSLPLSMDQLESVSGGGMSGLAYFLAMVQAKADSSATEDLKASPPSNLASRPACRP